MYRDSQSDCREIAELTDPVLFGSTWCVCSIVVPDGRCSDQTSAEAGAARSDLHTVRSARRLRVSKVMCADVGGSSLL
jgi:hypothetical protein